MRNRTVLTLALALTAPLAAAATFSPDAEKDRIDSTQLAAKFGPVPKLPADTRIGGVMKALSNEYWQLLRKGYQNGARKYGVQVDAQAPSNESDQIGQLSMMNTMMGKGYKAFLLSPQTDANLLPGVQRAKDRQLLTINVNDALVSTTPHFVGNIQRQNGVSVAEYLIKTFPTGGKVAVIEGQPGVYAAGQRTGGFKDTLAKSKFKVVASVPANWDRQQAFNVARDILRKNPDLTAFYANNDTMALGVVEAVKSAGRLGKTLVFGTDGINAAYDSIKKGELTGTVDSFPVLTGEVAMEVTVRLLAGQKLPRVIATPQALVTKANYKQYEQFK